ncbi:MAG: restriction endonuclease subunit S [Lentilactobacillus sunkii]|jgi:type I restriction enzyme S subunit|uniref:restriction endonuclease subunit S n=1 Tax=Lentilactobacillus sunkii TaxID=481719 RepID=UPI002F352464
MNDKKQPKIRFKGFADDWEQRKLGDIITFLNGRAYKQSELLDKGKYPVLRVGNFYTNDSWYYSNLELPDKNYANRGDLLYTWSATFGPHIWNGGKVIYHYHIWKLILSSKISKYFALTLLNADKEQLLSNTNGSTMIHVTKYEMESKVIGVPNLSEQESIGKFLVATDRLIAANQHKLDELKQLKKLLMQKIFSQEWRFKGFTDPWEQRKLKELTTLIKDGTHGTHEDGNDAFLLSAKNIKNGQVWIDPSSDRKISNNDYQSILKNYKMQKGDLLVSIVGTIGQTALFQESGVKVAFQRSVAIIRGNEKVKQDFLKATFDSSNVQKQLKRFSTMSAQAGVYLGDLNKLNIPYPSVNEQEKIGEIVNNTNMLIAANQQKLTQLKQLKKYLMQNMFV